MIFTCFTPIIHYPTALRPDLRIASIPPARRMRRIDSGSGSPCRTVPAWMLRTSPVARSTSMSDPGENSPEAPGHGSTGRPMATALRKNSREKESATTQATPSSFRFSGAVSRLEPHPKSRPATTTSPPCTSAAKLGSTDSSVCILRTCGESTAYCPGESRSVLIPSPKHQVLPLMAGCVDTVFLSGSAGWLGRWGALCGERPGVCDVTCHRGGCHRFGGGQEDLRGRTAHPADEIAIVGPDAAFPGSQQPAVATETRTAPGRQHRGSGIGQSLDDPLPQCLLVDPARCGGHDEPHLGVHLPALEDGGRRGQVFQPAIGAGADECLLDHRADRLTHRHHMVHLVRERHLRPDLAQRDRVHREICRVGIRLDTMLV